MSRPARIIYAVCLALYLSGFLGALWLLASAAFGPVVQGLSR